MRILLQLLPTVLLWGAAIYVASTNAASIASGRGPVLAFPFLASAFPSLQGDPQAMGQASAALLGVLGCVTLVRALLRLRAAHAADAA
jgi:O-antigen ligase